MHDRIRMILEKSGVDYQVHIHEKLPIPIHTPHDFAQALGYDISRITKTLLLQAKDQENLCLVVAPINQRLNLKDIAEQVSCKRLQIADPQVLLQMLDYPPQGVSPIGAGSIPVLMVAQLMSFPTVLIGAGKAGVEIELSPQALQQMTHATLIGIS